uniref:Uncharacterized protein n=1 Tax=Lygus hesperus TaxID=30085 RepID=A0A0K8SYE2_LYGHE
MQWKTCFKVVPSIPPVECAERKIIVIEKSLCFNCLASTHTTDTCQSKNVCAHCKTPHNSMLHETISTRKSTEKKLDENGVKLLGKTISKSHVIQGTSVSSHTPNAAHKQEDQLNRTLSTPASPHGNFVQKCSGSDQTSQHGSKVNTSLRHQEPDESLSLERDLTPEDRRSQSNTCLNRFYQAVHQGATHRRLIHPVVFRRFIVTSHGKLLMNTLRLSPSYDARDESQLEPLSMEWLEYWHRLLREHQHNLPSIPEFEDLWTTNPCQADLREL